MSGYGGGFAAVYDLFTRDVDYDARAAFFLDALQREGLTPDLLLDLGCGTGSLSLRLARRASVIGVDLSADMLAVARQKALQAGADILFLQQDMRQLDLYGTVTGAVCALDGLNHLPNEAALAALFDRLRLFIQPGGLFVCDVNTLYKQREVLGDNTFVFEDEDADVLCVWRNRWEEESASTAVMLDFFTGQPDGRYERESEDFTERVYPPDVLTRLLTAAGFEIRGLYDDLTLSPPGPHCQRMTLIAKRTEQK